VDVLGALDDLNTALTTNDPAGVQGVLPTLQAAQNQILAGRSEVGARLNRVTSAANNLEAMKVNLNKVLSDKQDADILQVVSELANQQNAFQVALAASAKTAQLSLLDYLR